MAKLRSVIFLVLAVFFGLIASRQISKYIENRVQLEKGAAKVEDVFITQGVVVASTDIPWGTRLTDEQLRVTSWPKDCVPHGAFCEIKQLVGRAAKTELVKGEPILDPKLAPEGFKGGITGVIPDGKRAITIRVNEIAGVAGFVLPGSRVDVILTIEMKEGKHKAVSKMLLENMLVLAVDQRMRQEEDKPAIVNAVTLLASPDEAEKLALANNKGTLQLAMRNGLDATPVVTAGIGIEDILYMDTKGVANGASRKFAIEVIKGAERSQVTFDMPKQTITSAKESFEM
ncbi:MAG TPA: Flp pilus assembly protein CpaB [Candidatus Brocadiia bacterium]|nr:Flp pilus assembly protein CpaB [Candidatus Brocadiales bacterium]